MRAAGTTFAVVLAASAVLIPSRRGSSAVSNQAEPVPVVLISIDGLRPDYVMKADSYGLSIPHFRKLLRNGAHATGVRGVIPTVTYPSHATLVTGASPTRHGIHSNTTFDPLQKNQGGWYWYASDLQARALWDATRERGLQSAAIHWPVTVGASIDWNIPQYWRTGTADDRKLVRALSSRALIDSLEQGAGSYADGIDESIEADEVRARFVVELLRTRRPSLTLAYFTALDHAQHDSGPGTPEAKRVLERIDRIVRDVWEAAVDASHNRTVIAVVSDHGFVATSRAVNLSVPFIEAGLVTLGADGKPSRWSAMPWGAGASAAIVVADSAPPETAQRVRELLQRLASDPANGIDSVLDRDALRTAGGFPEASFLVAFNPGFTMGAALRGPLITPSTVRGMHGHLNTVPDLRASFFIAGPGIPAGQSLGEIDMRDIAPTLARLLGVQLPTAEGRDLLTGMRANAGVGAR